MECLDAFEHKTSKQGIFTQALLDGLTEADFNHDGIVEANELALYLSQEVPKRSAKSNPGGHKQVPQASGQTEVPWPLVSVPERRK
jgi:hypothetical protein